MYIAFSIVVTVLVVLQFVLWRISKPQSKRKYNVVKAGNPDKPTAKKITASNFSEKRFKFGDRIVDPSDYEIFIVEGESMSQNNIHNGDAVFVVKWQDSDKANIKDIKTKPVFVFEIDNANGSQDRKEADIEYKLRKYMSVFNSDEVFDEFFGRVSNEYPELIDCREAIESDFNKCMIKYRDRNPENGIIIFSNTLREPDKIKYSFHPLNFLVGDVKYIVPSGSFKTFPE
ncbi:MAG: hypothetical protein LBM07_03465 [Culturomica sp.]|jgi:hypothetical protein|nr:hypothetical protein [Culturomica sp.]